MKNYEDFIDGLRQDVPIPDQVWESYTDTLAHIEQLSEQRKEVYHMDRKANKKSKVMVKAAVAAGVFVTAAGIFSCTNPAAAAKLPLIGHIFEQISGDATYSGDYKNAVVLPEGEAPESAGTKKTADGTFTATDQGISITVSEVYSDGYSVYLTAKIELETGGFLSIPAHYTRRFGEKTSQALFIAGDWATGQDNAASALSNQSFEGKAVDDNTFIGMLKLDLDEPITAGGTLKLALSQLRYDRNDLSDSGDIASAGCIAGAWKLSVPFSVDSEHCKELSVNKSANGFCIGRVFVSPYQVIVFCDAPYTTFTPETYTREDFEEQWGQKNSEIAAAGETPVTYEDMLSKKFYSYFETAVYNQDGDALPIQYGDEGKFVFAVQDLDLQKLIIYLTDASDFTGGENEGQTKEHAVLEAQIDL